MNKTQLSSLLGLTMIAAPLAAHQSAPQAPRALAEATAPRASLRKMTHLLAIAPQIAPMGTYVGKLQEKWQFPSDHVPIGISMGGVHFASWNVLDNKYMAWVLEKDSQGLRRSLIAQEHVYLEGQNITVRDVHVAEMILDTLNHPTHPKHVLTLQECGEPFAQHLKSVLPPHYALIVQSGNAIIVDQRLFDIEKAEEVGGMFKNEPERTVQNAYLRNKITNERVRLVNCHIPGDPTKPARYEFAQYLGDTLDPEITTMGVGDMNFNELEMKDAIQKAEIPFSLYTAYCTNISPYTYISKAIDHYMVYSPNRVEMLAPEEVMTGLTETIALLEPNQVVERVGR